MKKITYIILVFSLFHLLVSCGTWSDQMGYPDKVTMPKEGGEIKITGDEPIADFELVDEELNRKGVDDSVESDMLSVTFQWLTVEYPKGGTTFIIKANPSLDEKKRKMRIRAYSGPAFADIVVWQ